MSFQVQNSPRYTPSATPRCDLVPPTQLSATPLNSTSHLSSLITLNQAGDGRPAPSTWALISSGLQACKAWIISLLKCLFCFGASTENRIREIAQKDGFIWFYEQKTNPLTAFLGNFHMGSFRMGAHQFLCAEAAFQAHKVNPSQWGSFSSLNGDQAFRLARSLTSNWNAQQHADWRTRNLDVMRNVLWEKFTQNPHLQKLLLATGSACLIEHCPQGRDAYWADNGDGTGQNWLGVLLMELRGKLGGIGVQPRPPGYRPHHCK